VRAISGHPRGLLLVATHVHPELLAQKSKAGYISALAQRAHARAPDRQATPGVPLSQILRDRERSHTTVAPSCRHGTLPASATASRRSRDPGR
jgi:hypothetical protein